jgi:hypothetical protein
MPTSHQLASLSGRINKLGVTIRPGEAELPDWMEPACVKDAVATILAKLVAIRWPGRKLDGPEFPEDIDAALVDVMGAMLEAGDAHAAISCGYGRVLQWEREYRPETPETTEAP